MKKYVSFVAVAVIACAVGFGGGTVFAKQSRGATPFGDGSMCGGNSTFRVGAGGDAAAGGQGRGTFRDANGAGGFVAGEVLSLNENGITVKLPDGGSKIIFSSASTEVSRPTEVKIGDLKVGESVLVTGTPNDDGSVTAASITIRTGETPMMPMGGRMPQSQSR